MARAISVNQLFATKRALMEFDGPWLESFGKPENNANWFIMAPPGSGKTTFTSMLAKYLTGFGKVAFDSIEEGDSETIKLAWVRVGMKDVSRAIILLDREPIAELRKRLKKPRSPRKIVLDTVQHSNLTRQEYLELRRDFPNHQFIWVSHMKGNKPEGRLAEFIYQDAAIKVRIEGYVAFPTSRYGGNKPFIIWPEGAAAYHGPEILKYAI